MRPGEYINTLGRKECVQGVSLGVGCCRPGMPDFPAALEALQALAEEAGKAPWVEFRAGEWDHRIRADGIVGQYQSHLDGRWIDCDQHDGTLKGFREGLKAAHHET
jgi:hypothetical protein